VNELVRRLKQDVTDGRSRRQIAERADLSDATIRKLLAGGQAKHEVYQKLAENYLHVPVEEVYRMAEILPPVYGPDGKFNRTWLLPLRLYVLSPSEMVCSRLALMKNIARISAALQIPRNSA